MKFSKNVSSERRKSRKAHFTAPSSKRRVIMSASLSKQLRAKYGVRSLPVRKDDEVQIVRGKYQKEAPGKVIAVYRKRFCIWVERIVKDKATGQQVQVPIHPSNVQITKLKLGVDRKRLLDRKRAGRSKLDEGKKGKFTDKDVAMADVD